MWGLGPLGYDTTDLNSQGLSTWGPCMSSGAGPCYTMMQKPQNTQGLGYLGPMQVFLVSTVGLRLARAFGPEVRDSNSAVQEPLP